MEGKKYELVITMADGSKHILPFVAPQGEPGPPGVPTDEQVMAAVRAYMDEHKTPVALVDYIYLPASAWVGSGNIYSQVVYISGVTANSQVDLTPSVEQLAVFYDKSLALVAENEDGVVTVYAIGQKPEQDYEIQVTVTEVIV